MTRARKCLTVVLAAAAGLLTTGFSQPGAGRLYLVSVVLPLKKGEYVSDFKFDTWGVDFLSICHFPGGWRLRAGRGASSDGVFEGEASQGVTYLGPENMNLLRNLAVIRVYGGPVQHAQIGPVPATFAGTATVGRYGGDERQIKLNDRNLRLVPARRCPMR